MAHLPGALVLRPATPGDAGAVALLHADSWRRHYRGAYADGYLDGDLVGDRRAVWSDRLERPSARARTVLAELDQETVGFGHVVLRDDSRFGALVDNLHVRHDHQRAGIGRRVLGAIAGIVAGDPADPPGLYLWVLRQNAEAQAFYAACGGSEVERAIALAPGGVASRLVGAPEKLRIAWPTPARLAAGCSRGA